jgi:hypothetical protein
VSPERSYASYAKYRITLSWSLVCLEGGDRTALSVLNRRELCDISHNSLQAFATLVRSDSILEQLANAPSETVARGV